MFSINLKDTDVYQFRALPFGLNTVPLIFTRIVESIASHLRLNFCLPVHVYLDDWLFQHQDRESFSNWCCQSFEYLSLRFCTDLEVVRPADHLLDKLHLDLRDLMRKLLVTLKELQSFLGLINFLVSLT